MKNVRAIRRNLLRAFLHRVLFALAFLAPACHLDQDTRTERTLSFSQRYDELSQYDSLVIEVKDADGGTLAILFQAKAMAAAQLDDLDVPGWDGGPIVIVISGYDDGQATPVFREEKRYNGGTRRTDSTLVLVHPHPTLASSAAAVSLNVGQRLPLPRVDVLPANLANPALTWTSDNPGVAAVDGAFLVGVAAGQARLTVAIGAGADQKLVFTVQVGADAQSPDRLLLDKDTLYLAQGGAPGRFGIRIEPATASQEAAWRIADSTKAALRPDGSFAGLAIGVTKVYAASKAKPSVQDSGVIVVQGPVPVASVRFRDTALVLYLGGAPESLQVDVLPALANPEVRFTLSDPSKATLAGKLLTPKALGAFTVRVQSVEDTSKSGLLPVTVKEPLRVTGVEAADAAVTLYLGGPGKTLTARVLPSEAPQGVRWKSLSPAVAFVDALTGAVQPLLAGLAQVVVTSQADTSARDTVAVTVKSDVPSITVAADTLVSAGATVTFRITVAQEFGTLVLFQWDLDGDLAWDDSSPGPWGGTSVPMAPLSRKYDRSGRVTARFRVTDSEGNVAQASWTLRVVGGAAVSIDAPADNSYTNQRRIRVEWSVNGKPQTADTVENLAAIGPNVIRRSALDSAGMPSADSITVYLDTAAPARPTVSGTSPTNLKPKWTWVGGGGGSGEFRIRLGDADFPANAPTRRDSAYTLETEPVSGQIYTLYVQERDLAGNWSPAASHPIRYDVSKPVVAITAPQASGTFYTSTATAALSGTASGPLPITRVAYRLGAGAEAVATLTGSAWSTPALPLQADVALTATVIATDQAGNTGEASVQLFLDATKPSAPTILSAPPAESRSLKGTFSWSAGSDGAVGSGLNGRYRFRLNGGAWKDTSATLLTDLPLPAGNVTFDVQEQDRALNWSTEASRSVLVDTVRPAITLTSHSNPATSQSLKVVLSGTVRDTGTAVASMTVSGQASGSGTVTVTGNTWKTDTLTLQSGSNALVLTATDRVDNVRTLNVTVNVSVPVPVVVITDPPDNTAATNQASIVVSYRINNGAVQTQTFGNLAAGPNSLVVTSPPNEAGISGKDTVIVTRDIALPNAPTLARGTSPTNGAATWTWTSNGDNAGGAGVRSPNAYRYQLNGGAWVETAAARYDLNTNTDGSYTLVVQELDRAGNWSLNSAAQTIVVDKTAPKVVISNRSNYITSASSTTIYYKVDNGTNELSKSCTLAEGSNNCIATASDGLNTGADTVVVWRRANVVFFSTTGAGAGTGVDWENAMRTANLPNALEDAQKYSGKEFWVGTGDFRDTRITIPFPLTMITGFNAAALPYNTNNRTRGGTRFGYLQVYNANNVRVDGAAISAFGADPATTTAVMTDIDIEPVGDPPYYTAIYLVDGPTVTFNNVRILNKTFSNRVVYASSGTLNLVGGSITGNTSDYNAILVQGTVNVSGGFTASGNLVTDGSSGSYQYRVLSTGKLTVASGTALNCSTVIKEPGGTAPCP